MNRLARYSHRLQNPERVENDCHSTSNFCAGLLTQRTTLVYQLLASHSQIAGVYETEILKKLNAPRRDVQAASKKFSRSDIENRVVQQHSSTVFEGLRP